MIERPPCVVKIKFSLDYESHDPRSFLVICEVDGTVTKADFATSYLPVNTQEVGEVLQLDVFEHRVAVVDRISHMKKLKLRLSIYDTGQLHERLNSDMKEICKGIEDLKNAWPSVASFRGIAFNGSHVALLFEESVLIFGVIAGKTMLNEDKVKYELKEVRLNE